MRLAANLAIDRQAINEARTFGMSRVTGSIIPSTFDFYWPPPAPVTSDAAAKRLLAEAGYPNGFDAGDYSCDMTSADAGEVMSQEYSPASKPLGSRPRRAGCFAAAASYVGAGGSQ